jgi:hypothetical protein
VRALSLLWWKRVVSKGCSDIEVLVGVVHSSFSHAWGPTHPFYSRRGGQVIVERRRERGRGENERKKIGVGVSGSQAFPLNAGPTGAIPDDGGGRHLNYPSHLQGKTSHPINIKGRGRLRPVIQLSLSILSYFLKTLAFPTSIALLLHLHGG